MVKARTVGVGLVPDVGEVITDKEQPLKTVPSQFIKLNTKTKSREAPEV